MVGKVSCRRERFMKAMVDGTFVKWVSLALGTTDLNSIMSVNELYTRRNHAQSWRVTQSKHLMKLGARLREFSINGEEMKLLRRLTWKGLMRYSAGCT